MMMALSARAGQLLRVVFGSDKDGEVRAAVDAFNRLLTSIDLDYFWLADTVENALVPTQESPRMALDDGWLPVRSVTLYKHHKAAGGRPTARAEYDTDLGVVVDYSPFQHRGYARDFACRKWRALGGGLPLPDTVVEAVERQDELAQDVEIMVDTSGRFPQVTVQRIRQGVSA
jgi:hypothetical protein